MKYTLHLGCTSLRTIRSCRQISSLLPSPVSSACTHSINEAISRWIMVISHSPSPCPMSNQRRFILELHGLSQVKRHRFVSEGDGWESAGASCSGLSDGAWLAVLSLELNKATTITKQTRNVIRFDVREMHDCGRMVSERNESL